MRRITSKLTVAIGVGIALVMSVHAYMRVERTREMLYEDVVSDHLALGRAIAETVGALADRAGIPEAMLAVEEADRRRDHIDVSWVTSGSGPERSRFVEEGGGLFVVTEVPVDTGGARLGHLVLRESLEPQRAYVRGSAWRVAAVALLTLLLCAAIVHVAGHLLLDRPLAPILAKIQRIGEGALEPPLASERPDELGVVAREIDEMCRRLGELQRTAAREADARVAAVDQLRHADRLSTIGKLAAGIAHELGTPLNVAAARAKMIETGESEGDEIRDDARVIREQTERMTRIIRQLLDFARPRPPEREPSDVRGLASTVIAMLAPLGRRHGVTLTLTEGDPVEAKVDAGQIQQVLTNLIMNGIQAQPDGGAVEVSVRTRDADATIVVTDRGPGLPDAVRERIFEPFFTTKDVGQGTGLGMSVVHGIVQEHGGRIEVESGVEPGEGARFTVRLPVEAA